MKNLLKAAELQQPYRRPWWQPILGNKCCTQRPFPSSPSSFHLTPKNGSVFVHMFCICMPPEASHPSVSFYQRRWFRRSKRLQSSFSVSLRSYYINYFQLSDCGNKGWSQLSHGSDIRTIYAIVDGAPRAPQTLRGEVGSTLGQSNPRAFVGLRSLRHVGAKEGGSGTLSVRAKGGWRGERPYVELGSDQEHMAELPPAAVCFNGDEKSWAS